MSTLRTWNGFALSYNGVLWQALASGAIRQADITLTSGVPFRQQFTVAAAATQVILTVGAVASGNNVPGITHLVVYSDQLIALEIQGGAAANNSNVQVGPLDPFTLTGNQTRVYNAAGGFAGALTPITKITVKNEGGTSANVDVFCTY